MTIQPGNYLGRPVGHYIDKSKTGTMFVAVEFEIDGAPDTVEWRGYFTSASTPYTVKALRLMGFAPGTKIVSMALDAAKAVPVEVGEHEYNGKIYTRVERVGGEAQVSSITPDEFAKIDALISMASNKGAPAPASNGQTSATATSDEIPF